MEEKDRTLGLRSVVSISVGLVIATSCLVSLGQGAGSIGVVFIGAMVIACLLNMTTVASLSELNALMPNTTGGLAQYTLACICLLYTSTCVTPLKAGMKVQTQYGVSAEPFEEQKTGGQTR